MSRPWEYPRWRRVLMQGVMWLVLGGTLGLAQLITYQRNHVPVELAEPVRLGPLLVRLPAEWAYERGTGPGGLTLLAQDRENGRVLMVMLVKMSVASQSSAEQQEQGKEVTGSRRIEFHGLHQEGAMLVVRRLVRTQDGAVHYDEGLRAITVLPPDRGIIIELGQIGPRIGSADRLILQRVADGITLAGPTTQPADPPQLDPAPPDEDN